MAPRFGFSWQPLGAGGRLSVRGGYGLFYQTAGLPQFTAPPFAQGFTNADSSNNFASLQNAFPTTTLGYVLRTPTSQLSDRVAGPEYVVPRLHQWNLSTQFRLLRGLTFDTGYVGSAGRRLLLDARPQSAPAGCRPAPGSTAGTMACPAHCITTNTAQNAGLRVPILGETPTALAANEFSGASAYHSLQFTLRKQAAHALSFQATYTYSRAATNTSIYNDPNNLTLDWARSNFDRTHRFTANFDYGLPARLKGWTLAGHRHRAERIADYPERSEWRRSVRPRRAGYRYALSRRVVCRPGDRRATRAAA